MADKTKNIVLVPGLFLPALVLRPLKKALEEAGHNVHVYTYPLKPSEDDLGALFTSFVRKVNPHSIIGHSVGGMIALSNIEHLPGSVKKILCIASPLAGSSMARRIKGIPVLRHLISASAGKLLEGIPINTTVGQDVKVFMFDVSTNSGNGLPNMLLRAHKTNGDGTVALRETHHPKVNVRIGVLGGHTSVLFSRILHSKVVLTVSDTPWLVN